MSDGRGTGGGDDAAVVAALWAGDEDVFLSLLEAHHSVLLRVAMACGCSREGARDVVRRTWLATLERLPAFDGRRSSLRAWITGIAAEIGRAHGPEPSAGSPDLHEPDGDEEPILRAIGRLPAPERLVVTLRDLERWAAGETSQALGLPEPTQRRLLHTARTALCTARERDDAAAAGRTA
jgi:DNA-directed RNA polymerase specialized sigma24 family protein